MVIKKLKDVNYLLYRWVIIPKFFGFSRSVGRNNLGRITAFRRGGGHKRLFRFISWNFIGVSRCIGVYYDPNRSAFLALIQPVVTASVQVLPLFWVLAPKGISSGVPFNLISCFYSIKINLAENLFFFSRKQLCYFALQQEVHSVSVLVGSLVGCFSLSAGCSACVSSFIKSRHVVVLILPSGKFCFLSSTCVGSSGRVSNSKHYLKQLYKAGQRRWLGRRPIVRGVAINPVDHPHGGRTNGGRPSVRPWGKLTKVQKKKKLLLFMYSTYSFLFQLDVRKKSLLKLSEPQRVRLFFVISEHFSLLSNRRQFISSANSGLLSQTQLGLLSVKVHRASVYITLDCVGLPLSVYSGNSWKAVLVKKAIVGYPLRFFVLATSRS